MLGKNWLRKSITFLTTLAVWCVYSMAALAAPQQDAAGVINVTGQVTVNGQATERAESERIDKRSVRQIASGARETATATEENASAPRRKLAEI